MVVIIVIGFLSHQYALQTTVFGYSFEKCIQFAKLYANTVVLPGGAELLAPRIGAGNWGLVVI